MKEEHNNAAARGLRFAPTVHLATVVQEISMNQETIQRGFYISLCNKDEIDRIFNVQSTADYLLKQRADATLHCTRIHRVFLRRCYLAGDKWNFTESFDDTPFKDYIDHLEFSDYDEAQKIIAGFVFCDDPNGRIRKTEFGNVIMISESLRYFLYFMNLAYLQYDECNIPADVRNAAIKIAMRTMLQTEALDFDLDPRGAMPDKLAKAIQWHTNRQLQFIIGHEYSHGFLGHLENANIIEAPMLSYFKECDWNLTKIYSPSQMDEFDADMDAIARPIFTPDSRADYLKKAMLFFAYLDVFESVKEQIAPSSGRVKSHPDPIDRFWNLFKEFKGKVEIADEFVEIILKLNESHKEGLKEDVAVNIDSYENYGSIYLESWKVMP